MRQCAARWSPRLVLAGRGPPGAAGQTRAQRGAEAEDEEAGEDQQQQQQRHAGPQQPRPPARPVPLRPRARGGHRQVHPVWAQRGHGRSEEVSAHL